MILNLSEFELQLRAEDNVLGVCGGPHGGACVGRGIGDIGHVSLKLITSFLLF